MGALGLPQTNEGFDLVAARKHRCDEAAPWPRSYSLSTATARMGHPVPPRNLRGRPINVKCFPTRALRSPRFSVLIIRRSRQTLCAGKQGLESGCMALELSMLGV